MVNFCDACKKINKRESRKRDKNRSNLNNHRSRAKFYGVKYEPVNRLKVYERDGWMCGICNKKVDKRLKYPHPKSASLDHIVPMSHRIWEYGHTYLNTQCAHWICNVLKAETGAGDQLALIG